MSSPRGVALTCAVVLAAAVGVPAAAAARPAGSCRCASVVFIRHMPWRAFDARGAAWNPIAAPAIKTRLRAYARGKLDAFRRECARDEFTKRVCRAAAKCAIAGGFTLWAGVQTGPARVAGRDRGV